MHVSNLLDIPYEQNNIIQILLRCLAKIYNNILKFAFTENRYSKFKHLIVGVFTFKKCILNFVYLFSPS